MSVKRVLATALFVFFASFGLKAVAVDHVPHVMSLLAVVQPGNYQSSVAVALRSEIMKLDVNQLQHVIQQNPNRIFHRPYGFSLIHGWMLNQFADKRIPFYINQHFSFDQYIKNMIAATLRGFVGTDAWINVRAEIEANRWEYYQQMQYIPAAIAQAGVPGGIAADVIKPAYVQALDPAGFNAHAESIVGADLKPSDMKTRFESVMLWQLKNFDLNLLLPINYEINEPRKFVEYVSLKCPGVDTGRVFAVADKAASAVPTGHEVLLTSLVSLAVHQAGHVGGIATAKNELEQYAVEQPKGDPTQGVPNLAAAAA